MEARTWIERFVVALGVDPLSQAEADATLSLAAVAARASERTAAPITCWLAASTGRRPADALALARRVAGDVAEAP